MSKVKKKKQYKKNPWAALYVSLCIQNIFTYIIFTSGFPGQISQKESTFNDPCLEYIMKLFLFSIHEILFKNKSRTPEINPTLLSSRQKKKPWIIPTLSPHAFAHLFNKLFSFSLLISHFFSSHLLHAALWLTQVYACACSSAPAHTHGHAHSPTHTHTGTHTHTHTNRAVDTWCISRRSFFLSSC